MEPTAPCVESAAATSWRLRLARSVALATVLASVAIPWMWRSLGIEWNSAAVTLIGLTAILLLRDGDTEGLGFRLAPEPGWVYWCRTAAAGGLVIGGLVAAWAAVALTLRWPIVAPRLALRDIPHALFFMGLLAPVVEELAFRSLLTFAVRQTIGEVGTILVSGLLFAAIHILGGNPSPENQLGGFVLAWVYLRSGTLLVPIAMHAAGNLLAVVSQVASGFWLPANWP